MAFITVAGINFPYPDSDSGLQTTATFVSDGRNQFNEMVGQTIGRDQVKIELRWHKMNAQLWAKLLQLFSKEHGGNFVNPVRYYDMVLGRMHTRNLYVSDRSSSGGGAVLPSGEWIYACNCSLSLVDSGWGD